MSKYELTVIVDANLPEVERESIHKQVADAITKAKGKVINSNVIFEKHKMSFPINDTFDGHYTLYNLEIDGHSQLPKLKKALALNEKLLRYLFVCQTEKKAKATA